MTRARDLADLIPTLHSLSDMHDMLAERGVGTVSQADGIPTGAIVQSGSNADGSYVRWADGTQICHHRITLGFVSSASLYAAWTFPQAFSAAPTVVATVLDHGTYAPGRGSLGAGGVDNPPTATGAEIFQSRDPAGPNFVAGNTIDYLAMAVGRWY